MTLRQRLAKYSTAELKAMCGACKELIHTYETSTKIKCPLCRTARAIKSERGSDLAYCVYCPWIIFDLHDCYGGSHHAREAGYAAEYSIGIFYPYQSLPDRIERLVRWISSLTREIALRNAPRITPSKLKALILAKYPDNLFFSHDNMRFAGDTMKNFGVRSVMLLVEGEEVPHWELYRKQPTSKGAKLSNFFNKETLKRYSTKDR
jgi:LSD1 subclass zinc finger protein